MTSLSELIKDEQLREKLEKRNFNDADALAKSYFEAERKMTEQGTELSSLRTHVAPTDISGYTNRFEKFKELGITEEEYNEQLKNIHAMGFNDHQAGMYAEKMIEGIKAAQVQEQQQNELFKQQFEKQRQEGIGALHKRWGADYEKHMTNASKAAEHLGYNVEGMEFEDIGKLEMMFGFEKTQVILDALGQGLQSDPVTRGDYFEGTRSGAMSEFTKLKNDSEFMKKATEVGSAEYYKFMELAKQAHD